MSKSIAPLIRPALRQDIEALVSLRAYLLDDHNHIASYVSKTEAERVAWKAAYRHWLDGMLTASSNIHIVVAEQDECLIGCATGIVDMRPPAPDCQSGYCGWIQSVVVLPDYRCRKIGAELMAALMGWFGDFPAAKILLESTPQAERLYANLGFARSSEKLFIWRGDRL